MHACSTRMQECEYEWIYVAKLNDCVCVCVCLCVCVCEREYVCVSGWVYVAQVKLIPDVLLVVSCFVFGNLHGNTDV